MQVKVDSYEQLKKIIKIYIYAISFFYSLVYMFT